MINNSLDRAVFICLTKLGGQDVSEYGNKQLIRVGREPCVCVCVCVVLYMYLYSSCVCVYITVEGGHFFLQESHGLYKNGMFFNVLHT